MDQESIKKWMYDNLCGQKEAMHITGQSASGFTQSVATGRIKPFSVFEWQGGKNPIRLYLKSELQEYAKTKRIR